MKPKLLLGLALVLSVGVFYCVLQKPSEPAKDKNYLPKAANGKGYPKKLKGKWIETQITLYRKNGSSEVLRAKQAVYEFGPLTNEIGSFLNEAEVVAFVDPQTGRPWLGVANGDDVFIETASGILGVVNYAKPTPNVIWIEPVITKAIPGQTVDAIIDRFEKEIDGWWLGGCEYLTDSGDTSNPRTEIKSHFRRGFFASHVSSSKPALVKPQSVMMRGGMLRLEFKSLALGTTGWVWIDPNTRKVIWASEWKYVGALVIPLYVMATWWYLAIPLAAIIGWGLYLRKQLKTTNATKP